LHALLLVWLVGGWLAGAATLAVQLPMHGGRKGRQREHAIQAHLNKGLRSTHPGQFLLSKSAQPRKPACPLSILCMAAGDGLVVIMLPQLPHPDAQHVIQSVRVAELANKQHSKLQEALLYAAGTAAAEAAALCCSCC
jgi:hypothetical protein